MIVTRLNKAQAFNGSALAAGDFIVLEDDGTITSYNPADMYTAHPEYIQVAGGPNIVLADHVALKDNVLSGGGSGGTFYPITGLNFPVQPGYIYSFRAVITYSISPDLLSGMIFGINGPTATKDYFTYFTGITSFAVGTAPDVLTTQSIHLLLPSMAIGNYRGYTAPGVASISTANNFAIIEGFVIPSAAGIIEAEMAADDSSYTITAKKGSYLDYIGVPV